MNPILMNLSSVQSLTHDQRPQFASRFADMTDGVDVHPVRPEGVFARLTAWVVGGQSLTQDGVLGVAASRVDAPAPRGLIAAL